MDDSKELSKIELDKFNADTEIIIEQSKKFIEVVQPSYSLDKGNFKELFYNNSDELLKGFVFFKINSCFTDDEDEVEEILTNKITKFYAAIHSLDKPIIYGVISLDGTTNLVIGISASEEESSVLKSVLQGLLDGVQLEKFKPITDKTLKYSGIVSGVPSVKNDEQKYFFDIGPIMKGLNGQNYTLLFIARPIKPDVVSNKYGQLIQIKDSCFALSKRNMSRQHGETNSVGETKGTSNSHTHTSTNTVGGNFGLSFIVSLGSNYSHSESDSYSFSENFSKTVSEAISNTTGESHDVQNGLALEVMEYTDKAIERLRQGMTNGLWETVITYTADNKISKQILDSCLLGEIAKPNKDLLPPVLRTIEDINSFVLLPKILNEEKNCSVCTPLTSQELGFICTPPVSAVPNFEIKKEKIFPLVSDNIDGITVGWLNDGTRKLDNMSFNLNQDDLVRHTFVCGMTGSGKTTTVKRILEEANKEYKTPFLVIESAKAEYRNMSLQPYVYTLGKPALNCIPMNPFYIQKGVNPQTHIDYLKDLFNASFSFYGPMPYILEKCLNNIYRKKGWNLNLGYHPYLSNTSNLEDFFDFKYVTEKYKYPTHKYLFPTMADLKDEIERYIEEEMNYEGEVAGNIKTALKARLENLCSGEKGFMFNTHDYLDMEQLLNQNVVFELEGLADDADKAFAVGLTVIYINEYRQVQGKRKESESPLAHLLVIEEAHRLLKNISTDKTSEDIGNPKGKAVEHFTNMIAEMRSYGQGVIVAEQIPCKLAPDVIKNSANKIVQTLVSGDDQLVMSNTIGLTEDESIQIGYLRKWMGLCHKEGMCKPVLVNISGVTDIIQSDTMLYHKYNNDRITQIDLSTLNESIGSKLDLLTIQTINALVLQDEEIVSSVIELYRRSIKRIYMHYGLVMINKGHDKEIQLSFIAQKIVQMLMQGFYKVKDLITEDFQKELNNTLYVTTIEHLDKLQNLFKIAYDDDPKYKIKSIIKNAVIDQYSDGKIVKEMIEGYFAIPEDRLTKEILELIKEEK